MDRKVGTTLKSLRGERKMTLKELSQATGLSISYLSQVEREISSVNINSLGRIAKALNVPTEYFLELPAGHRNVVMRSHEQSVFTVKPSTFYYSRMGNDTMDGRALEPILVSILPRTDVENVRASSHEGEEFVYVLEGMLTLLIGNEEVLLYPGDSAHYDSNVPHEWANFTTKMVKIISISTPALFPRPK